jgi:hypothetical protein
MIHPLPCKCTESVSCADHERSNRDSIEAARKLAVLGRDHFQARIDFLDEQISKIEIAEQVAEQTA